MRKDRDAQEVTSETNPIRAELGGPRDDGVQRDTGSTVCLHIFRNDPEIGRDPLPQTNRRAQRVQISKVNQVLIEKLCVVSDVAQTDVEMPVHPLKRADDDTIFGRWHAEEI